MLALLRSLGRVKKIRIKLHAAIEGNRVAAAYERLRQPVPEADYSSERILASTAGCDANRERARKVNDTTT